MCIVMQKKTKITVILSLVMLMGLTPLAFINFSFATTGEVIATCGDGYIKDLGNGKELMHLEGSSYDMGYQQGFLDPISVTQLASQDWFEAVIMNLLDAPDWILSIILRDIMD